MKKYRRLVLLLVAGVATYFTISQIAFLDLYKTAKLVHVLRLLCAGFLTRTSLGTSNIVDLGYAQYAGNLTYLNAVAYLGIPYAEPPLGERRFRKALSLNTTRIGLASQGRVIDATQYPEFCVQGTTGSGEAGGAGSEDCLKVNIYAPAGTKKGDKLPVLVYFHGGGYTYGNPANWPFDHWIHQSPNVVAVSVYYRLDSFGFLSVPDFLDPSVGDFNVGFQDQVEALNWVQQHITSFGGDPTKVTINGQSAGGSSVELHLVAREDKKYFSQAIAQSVYRTPLPMAQQMEPLFDFYAEHAGCGIGSVSSRLACLRNASVSALARAQDTAQYNCTAPFHLFHPTLDGKLIVDTPTVSILQGNLRDIPIIVGATSNETLSGGDIPTALKAFFPGLNDNDIDEYLEVYPSSDFDSDGQREQVATGESELICAREIIGTAAAKKSKAWTYRYNQAVPTSGSSTVGHASENWMMFQGTSTGFNGSTVFQPMRPVDKAFAEELIAYWLSFVRAGDPNTYKLARSPMWPSYTINKKERIVLQEGPDNSTTVSGSFSEVEPDLETKRCLFVASKVHPEQD